MADPNCRRIHLSPPVILDPATWRLHVGGLVQTKVALTLGEIERLAQARDSGTCLSVWNEGEPKAVWSGLGMTELFQLVQPLPRATCFYAHAHGFRALLPLDSAPRALLATRLNGDPLPVSRGGPCRLILPESSSRLSVKWVERIELFRRRRDP